MASHASALKAHRQSLKNREHNRQFRSKLRNALRGVRSAIDGKDLAAAKTALKETISLTIRDGSYPVASPLIIGRVDGRDLTLTVGGTSNRAAR